MTTPQRAEQEARRREWVKGDADDWVLLPVEKPKKTRPEKAKGVMQRAYQIFTNWAFAGHAHGAPVAPKGVNTCTCKGPVCTCEEEGVEADVATAEAALLAFARFERAEVTRKTRAALVRRHLDGKALSGADVLNAERCYRLAIRIEKGERIAG